MEKEREDILASLTKLRQGALLLSMANGYLCKPPLLRKIAREMYRALQLLPEEIKILRSRFPGKPETDEEINQILRELHQGVKQLGNAEAEIRTKCSQGDLGQEFELRIANLTAAVKAIAGQREDKTADLPTIKVSKARIPCASFPLAGYSRRMLTFFLPIVLIAGVLFTYLYLTMEREQEIREQMEVVKAQATSSRTILKEIEGQRDQLSRKLNSLRQREMQHADRVASLEIGQELHGIGERRTKVEMELEKYEEEVGRLSARLRQIEGKSFMARLLRL